MSGRPGLAAYHRAKGDNTFRPHAVQAIGLGDDGISALHTYLDPGLFPRFGLADVLEAGAPNK